MRAPEELQEKVSVSHVEYMELKISAPLSPISGLRAVVAVRYKLKLTQTLSLSLQFDYPMLLTIHVW